MRSTFAVMTLLFLLISSAAPEKKGIGRDKNNHPKTDNRGTKDRPLVVDVDKPIISKEEADQTQKKENLDASSKRWTVILTGVIAFSALVQIFIYLRQTGLMKSSLRETAKAAQAASDNASALIGIERPWLLIENLKIPAYTNFSDPVRLEGKFLYKIWNYGKTPARVCALKMRLEIGNSPDIPPNPSEVFGIPDFAVNPHIIPQGVDRAHTELIHPNREPFKATENRDLANELIFLWAYGFVRYLDVHGGYYETRICYRYDFSSQGLILAGPPEYNNAT